MDDTSERLRAGGYDADATDGAARRAAATASGSPGADEPSTEYDIDARTREIRRDIEHTRDEMSETIDAIQEKLRPANIVANAKERVRDSVTERMRAMKDSAEHAASSMMSRTRPRAEGFAEDLRHNRVPLMLMGLGAAWLFMNSRSQHGNGYARNRYEPYWEDEESFAERGDGGTAYGAASRAGDYTHEAADRVRYAGRRAQSQLQRMTRENPLAVGAGALLLGAAIGLALPETERENELLGDARDSMVDRAQEMARTAASRAQDAATELASDAASRIVGGTSE